MIYRREIDGLRAAAVGAVILYHFDIPGFSGGFFGVDIFFVISGFLITQILMEELRGRSFSLLNFYKRRILRIMPALVVVLAASTIGAWMLLGPQSFAEYARTLTATSTFVANIYFAQQADYFAPVSDRIPLLHMWSLAVEEQFYLFFPPLLFVAWRFAHRQIVCVFTTIIVVSFGYAVWGVVQGEDGLFFQTRARAWELAVGGLCAVIPPMKGRVANAGLAMIVVSIVGGVHNLGGAAQLWAIVPVMGTALLVRASGPSIAMRLLSTQWMVRVGLISYSAYLIHQPVFGYMHITMGGQPIITRLALIVGVMGLAALSYRYIEQPFRGPKMQAARPLPLLAGTFAVIIAFVGMGVLGHASRGAPDRFQEDPMRLSYSQTAISAPIRSRCHTEGADYIPPQQACVHGDGPPRISVFGDSHGVELAAALGEAFAPDISVLHLTFSACYPFAQVPGDNPNCELWTRDALNFLTAEPSIETVVLTYRLHAHMFGDHADIYPELLQSDVPRAAVVVEAEMARIVAALVVSGKRVVIVASPPDLPRHIEDLVFSQWGMSHGIVGAPRAWWDARRGDGFASSIAAGAELFDTAPLFCDVETCYGGRDGVSYYFDDNHLSVAGARMVAQSLRERLDP